MGYYTDGEVKDEIEDVTKGKGNDYYDPMHGKFGDERICREIKEPFLCVKQNVCGWCSETNSCVAGGPNGPYHMCSMTQFTFSRYPGSSFIF